MNRTRRIVFGLAIAMLVPVLASTIELPDSESNPITGNIESVDAPMGNDYQVRYVVDPGKGGRGFATTISELSAVSPRIAIRPDGDSWVTWWQDAGKDVVLVRVFDQAAASWGPEIPVSLPNEDSRYPEIVHDSGATWIVYLIDTGSGTSLATLSIIDSPDPWPTRVVAATTDETGDLDARIHAEAGHVWITWVEATAGEVGWAEFDTVSGTWGVTLYEAAGPDPDDTRDGIRTSVLAD